MYCVLAMPEGSDEITIPTHLAMLRGLRQTSFCTNFNLPEETTKMLRQLIQIVSLTFIDE